MSINGSSKGRPGPGSPPPDVGRLVNTEEVHTHTHDAEAVFSWHKRAELAAKMDLRTRRITKGGCWITGSPVTGIVGRCGGELGGCSIAP